MCKVNKLLIVLVLCTSDNWAKELTEIEALSSHPTHCTYDYAYDMYGAHCAGLRLNKLPNLRSGIEILDFSDNKLQELTRDTFSGYSSIKYLYLADNQIYSVDEDALSSLTGLEALDLSNNVILELPNTIFQLPSLRKLNLKGNPVLHKNIRELSLKKPILAPLQQLDISDCKIRELPNWGSLPHLVFYNISNNPLTSLDAGHFAAMCKLEKVDLTDSLDNIQLCNIRGAISWFQVKNIYFQLSDYSRFNTKEFASCPVGDELNSHNVTFNRCTALFQEVENVKRSRRTWLTVGGGLAGFLVGFILLLFIMHRVNVAQTKTTAEKMQQEKATRVADKHASTVLLNDVA